MSESVSAQMNKFQEMWGAYGGTNSNAKGIFPHEELELGTSRPDDINIDAAKGKLAWAGVMEQNSTGGPKMTPLEGSVMFQVNHLNEMGKKYGCDENTKKMINEAQELLLRSVAYGQTRNLRAGEGNLTNSVLFQMDALKKLETKYGGNDTTAKMIHETENRLVNN